MEVPAHPPVCPTLWGGALCREPPQLLKNHPPGSKPGSWLLLPTQKTSCSRQQRWHTHHVWGMVLPLGGQSSPPTAQVSHLQSHQTQKGVLHTLTCTRAHTHTQFPPSFLITHDLEAIMPRECSGKLIYMKTLMLIIKIMSESCNQDKGPYFARCSTNPHWKILTVSKSL